MIKGSRLGYACVNWGLTNRKKKEGGRVTTSRTLRKATWQLAEGWDYSAVTSLSEVESRTWYNIVSSWVGAYTLA